MITLEDSCTFPKHYGTSWKEVLATDRNYIGFLLDKGLRVPAVVRDAYEVPLNMLPLTLNIDADDLTPSQAEIWRLLQGRENVVVIGVPGAGKSFLVKNIAGNVVRIAPTGAAAIGVSGVTLHAYFNIDYRQEVIRPSARNVKTKSGLYIFDEVFFTGTALLSKVLSVILAADPDARFLFTGDPMQLKPVVNESGKSAKELTQDEEEELLHQSEWLALNLFQVLTQMAIPVKTVFMADSVRHQDSQKSFELIRRAREGKLTAEDMAYLNAKVSTTPGKNDLKLGATRREIDPINNSYLSSFASIQTFKAEPFYGYRQGPSGSYTYSGDRITKEEVQKAIAGYKDGGRFGLKIWRKVFKPTPTDVTKQTVRLAEGCRVMINRNDPSPSKSFVNGDMGIYLGKENAKLKIKLDRGHLVFVPAMEIESFSLKSPLSITTHYFYMGYLQFPVQLAAALTIHKSQGATIKTRVHILVDGYSFQKNDGMLYTAISRVPDLDLLTFSKRLSKVHFAYDKKRATYGN